MSRSTVRLVLALLLYGAIGFTLGYIVRGAQVGDWKAVTVSESGDAAPDTPSCTAVFRGELDSLLLSRTVTRDDGPHTVTVGAGALSVDQAASTTLDLHLQLPPTPTPAPTPKVARF
jgi:hypothetical protein